MDQPSSAYATHGKALKRHSKQRNKGARPAQKNKNLTNVKFYDILDHRKGTNIMPYKYNEKGKVIGYTPSIGGFMREPYTTNKKTGEWESRSGQLTRQRINQLDKEKKIAWF